MYDRKDIIEFLKKSGVKYKTTPEIFKERFQNSLNEESDWNDSLRLNPLNLKEDKDES